MPYKIGVTGAVIMWDIKGNNLKTADFILMFRKQSSYSLYVRIPSDFDSVLEKILYGIGMVC